MFVEFSLQNIDKVSQTLLEVHNFMLSISTDLGGVQKSVLCLVYTSNTFQITLLRPKINLIKHGESSIVAHY